MAGWCAGASMTSSIYYGAALAVRSPSPTFAWAHVGILVAVRVPAPTVWPCPECSAPTEARSSADGVRSVFLYFRLVLGEAVVVPRDPDEVCADGRSQ